MGSKKWTEAEKKKIALAKDVLKSLKDLKLTQNRYLGGSYKIYDVLNLESNQDKQLKKFIPKIKKECEMCAIGSFFVCQVDKFNDFKVGEIRGDLNNDRVQRRKLQEIFTFEELGMIETAFIGMDSFDNFNTPQLANRCIIFGSKYKIDKARLKAICLNIVQNGTFKPELGLKRVINK